MRHSAPLCSGTDNLSNINQRDVIFIQNVLKRIHFKRFEIFTPLRRKCMQSNLLCLYVSSSACDNVVDDVHVCLDVHSLKRHWRNAAHHVPTLNVFKFYRARRNNLCFLSYNQSD